MAAIQDLTPRLDAIVDRFREAKDAARLTIEDTAARSGLSVSTVSKVLSGVQRDPKLSTAAALACVYELSLDELTGLAPPSGSDAELLQRAHEAELAAASARGENEALRETFADTRAYAQRQARSTVALAALCAVLALVVVAYLLFDHTLLNAGLIINERLSPLAWGLVVLLAVAVTVSCRALLHALRTRS